MKRKLLVFVIALLVFGLTAGAYAIKANRDAANTKASCCNMDCCKAHNGAATTADAGQSCCGMENCCKDGHCEMGGDCCKGHGDNCPMKNSQATADQTVDMSQVVVVGGEDNCCQPGADCCNGGDCCHHKG